MTIQIFYWKMRIGISHRKSLRLRVNYTLRDSHIHFSVDLYINTHCFSLIELMYLQFEYIFPFSLFILQTSPNTIMSPINRAAILLTKGTPLKVQQSSYTPAALNEIVVKNAAVAINPYDWIVQEAPGLVVSWVKLPFVLGTDVAGEVVEVGNGVTRFRGVQLLQFVSSLNRKYPLGMTADSKILQWGTVSLA